MSNTELQTRTLGYCVICGRPLTNSESLNSFTGPICGKRYKYILDNVTTPLDAVVFAAECEKAGIEVDLSHGLNEASNQILRTLSYGMEDKLAIHAIDAIEALGYRNLAAIVGSALQITDRDFASLDPHAKVFIHNNLIAVQANKIPRNYFSNFLDDTRAIYGRRWDARNKVNTYPMLPQSAKGVVAMCNKWLPFAKIDSRVKDLASQEDVTITQVKKERVVNTAIVQKVKDDIEIAIPKYNGDFVAALKAAIPGWNKSWNKDKKVWWVLGEFIPQATEVVLRFYPDADVDAKIDMKKIQNEKILATAAFSEDVEKIELLGGALFPFQNVGVAFLESKISDSGGVIVGDDMGLGKTNQSITFVDRDIARQPALVTCPASVKYNWAKQIQKWTGDKYKIAIITSDKFSLYDSKKKYDVKDLPIFIKSVGIDFVIANYDLMKKNAEHLSYCKFQTFIIDESHYVKEEKSGRSKAVAHVAAGIPRKLLLTGSPILNRPKELWHQLYICNPKRWAKFTTFAYRYCDPKTSKFGTDFNGSSNAAELHDALIGHYMIRRKKIDVLKDLPDKNKFRTTLDVPKNDRSDYDSAVSDFKLWAFEEGGGKKLRAVAKAEALVKLTTLRKLSAISKTNSIISHCGEWLNSNEGEQLVIFAYHTDALKMIRDALKEQQYKVGTIFGGDAVEKRQATIEEFVNKKTQIIVASIGAAGTGTDGLQVCQNMMMVESTWRPFDMIQTEDRIWRIGQENQCSVEYLDMYNSIDSYIANVLDSKFKVINSIVDGEEKEEAGNLNIAEEVLDSFLEDDNETN